MILVALRQNLALSVPGSSLSMLEGTFEAERKFAVMALFGGQLCNADAQQFICLLQPISLIAIQGLRQANLARERQVMVNSCVNFVR